MTRRFNNSADTRIQAIPFSHRSRGVLDVDTRAGSARLPGLSELSDIRLVTRVVVANLKGDGMITTYCESIEKIRCGKVCRPISEVHGSLVCVLVYKQNKFSAK